jgi:DNA transformation protein and related proteins
VTKINSRGGKTKEASGKKARGPLKNMRVSMGFREFVLDQLGGIAELRAKPMFGGVGLYSGEHFFGILAADVAYFKSDDTTRRDYEAAGSKLFEPYANAPPATRPVAMPYYSVPLAVLESAPAIAAWAKRAISVAKASKKAKPAKASKTN